MSTNSWRDEIGPLLLIPQVIVAALTAGCLAFLAGAIFLVQTGLGPAAAGGGEMPLLTYMAVASAGMAVAARMVVSRMIESAGGRRIANGTWQAITAGQQPAKYAQLVERLGDAGSLMTVLNTRTIIGGAIIEGGVFFGLIAYLIDQSPIALAVAIAMIVGVALHFPTRSSATHWIEDQLAAIEQIRQFG